MPRLFDTHKDLLSKAVAAAHERTYWSAFPEVPSGKIYGETAKAEGAAAFQARLGQPFQLPGHPNGGHVGSETSPYGFALDITYPDAGVPALIDAATTAGQGWAQASIEERLGVCLEILVRLNKMSFEMAKAVEHTTGQSFVMAFQAGGPHAQDRGLEALAYAYAEMTRTPAETVWTKPQGKAEPIVLEKRYRVVPRGIALTIGCATFPTWNSYPGLFASLATGNPVVVKPHPAAVLPLAMTVEVGRQVLQEQGFDPNVLQLAADAPGAEKTKELALHPAVKIVDFTGSNAFGAWLRENVAQAQLFTEEAGVNAIVVASTDDFHGLCANIAFSLSLYSGQMCTSPQNIYVPRGGIETDEGHKSCDEVAEGLAAAVDRLLADPERAAGVCGALASPATLQRVAEAVALGDIVRPSTPVAGLNEARTATPLILKVDAAESDAHRQEHFGPIGFVVASDSAEDAIAEAAATAAEKGAITAAIYATEEALLDRAAEAFGAAGVNLSCNLTGNIFVNQSAAFSDYHVTGANPAGNACLTDAAFVANRFRIATTRRPQAA